MEIRGSRVRLRFNRRVKVVKRVIIACIRRVHIEHSVCWQRFEPSDMRDVVVLAVTVNVGRVLSVQCAVLDAAWKGSEMERLRL